MRTEKPSLPVTVIPPPTILSKLAYSFRRALSNLGWWILIHYVNARKALGPKCASCGERFYRTCVKCDLAEFYRVMKLAELRGEEL
jgi:hypothetical protein